MQFYLGTHQPAWLGRFAIPLMVSRRVLDGYRRLPRACAPWLCDSGGFSELNLHGKWTISPETYCREVDRFLEEIGHLQAAAIMDWMCEEVVLRKTGLTVRDHQTRTIDNYLQLRSLRPNHPWMPVLQGFAPDEYLWHLDEYGRRGVNLPGFPLVGVGSVCRRQHTGGITPLIKQLAGLGLRLHAFGIKTLGLPTLAPYLASSDSMAWSFAARRSPPLPECLALMESGIIRPHKNCANCCRYALRYRDQILALIEKTGPSRVAPPLRTA